MIILEKSELPFSKCPTKNYITPPHEKNVNPLKRGTSTPMVSHRGHNCISSALMIR